MKELRIKLSDELHKKLSHMKIDLGLNWNQLIEKLITKSLEKKINAELYLELALDETLDEIKEK
jgi:hypothetical protein